MQNTNIIILATFWNEIEWIDASLAQIEKINPKEVIICDGNFDPSFENKSTDGTREKIIEFTKQTQIPTKFISAIRVKNKFLKGLNIFFNSGCPRASKWNLGRAKAACVSQIKTNIYRINQSLTFANMCRLSKFWEIGRWVMTYDADQFYTDELIDAFAVTNDDKFDYDLISANELTFPNNFYEYTNEYEKRNWNNLPHKIKKNMAIYPTRHFMIENFFSAINYENISKNLHLGCYHHYKFRKNEKRKIDGYKLGDRKPPDPERFKNLSPSKNILFPSAVKKFFTI